MQKVLRCCFLFLCLEMASCDESGGKKKTDINNENNINNVNNINNINNSNNNNNTNCDEQQDVKTLHWLSQQKIYHGTTTGPALCMTPSQQLAIGALLQYDGAWVNVCTGTLVTDRLVLTAAHCVTDYRARPLDPSKLRFAFGTDAAFPLRIFGVRAVYVNPRYTNYSKTGYDHAVIELDGTPAADLGISPLPISRTSPANLIGHYVQQAGFGITERDYNNTQLWWTPERVWGVSDADGEMIVNGQGYSSVCNGDSGGPSLYLLGGNVLTVLGTVSWGDPSCVDFDHYARTDWDRDFLDTVLPTDFDYCGGLTFEGECEGNVARWCEGGLLHTQCCDARTGPCIVSGGRARCEQPRIACDNLDFAGVCNGDVAQWCWGGLAFSRHCAACNQQCTTVGSILGNYCQ